MLNKHLRYDCHGDIAAQRARHHAGVLGVLGQVKEHVFVDSFFRHDGGAVFDSVEPQTFIIFYAGFTLEIDAHKGDLAIRKKRAERDHVARRRSGQEQFLGICSSARTTQVGRYADLAAEPIAMDRTDTVAISGPFAPNRVGVCRCQLEVPSFHTM